MSQAGEIIAQQAYARAQARPGKAYFIRYERRPEWTGSLPIYVIWCAACDCATETHPAGYGRITCLKCRGTTDRVMTWQRFRDKTLRDPMRMVPIVGIIILTIAFFVLR